MNRRSLSQVHAAAGLIAWCLIASFFIGSLISELSGNPTWIVVVKRTIFYSMWAMVLLVPVAALTGRKLAGKSCNVVVVRKRKRMRWIAPNGLLLLTLGSYLYYKASQGQFDPFFRSAQLVELALGLTNLVLLGLMIRDGYRLKRRYLGQLP
ncbi:hypothetical protein [Spirosoma fluviale]|uniref:Transmembrane protein n=1 Tax=Spirosoma fluviale TaxID=1597977 RepID=A0A286GQA4_9BACT|nr:hypothetical protein [Spirosoma fluviale]SOD97700.1 hypothetical protein SAMN06269250_5890 [Spirosoma fluviale]